MMKYLNAILTAGLLGCIYVIILERGKGEALCVEVRSLSKTRFEELSDRYEFSATVPDAETISRLKLIYSEIAEAYTNEDVLAMYKGMSKLPAINDELQSQVAIDVEQCFLRALNGSFLRIKQLRDFRSAEDFDRYARTGILAARFYGESHVRRNSCEIPIAVEYLALDVLGKYARKFSDEGRPELAKVAEQYLDIWIAHIEMRDGLTRQCAWHTLKYNTVYMRTLKPELALTDEEGVRQVRQLANGLIHCGHTPRWLDEDFPTN